MIVFDVEIKKGILGRNEKAIDGIEYLAVHSDDGFSTSVHGTASSVPTANSILYRAPFPPRQPSEVGIIHQRDPALRERNFLHLDSPAGILPPSSPAIANLALIFLSCACWL